MQHIYVHSSVLFDHLLLRFVLNVAGLQLVQRLFSLLTFLSIFTLLSEKERKQELICSTIGCMKSLAALTALSLPLQAEAHHCC